jgi:hypothetical protein
LTLRSRRTRRTLETALGLQNLEALLKKSHLGIYTTKFGTETVTDAVVESTLVNN